MILRPRQKEFVNRCVAVLEAHNNTLGVAPTGAGKTVALSAVVGRLMESGAERATILQHRDELTAQNRETFHRLNGWGRSSGVIDARIKDTMKPVTFAMVQTLCRGDTLGRLPAQDILVVDEAHHVAARSYRSIIEHMQAANPGLKLFGVTATPNRGDKKPLIGIFDNCADQIMLGELIATGALVRPRTFVVDLGVREDLAKVKRSISDFDMAEVAKILDRQILNDQVVTHWKEKAGDRATVVFCSTVEHAKHVTEAFQAAGVSAACVEGSMGRGDRERTLKAFEAGQIQVIVNVAVLTEGWDCLDDATEILTPTGWKSVDEVVAGTEVMAFDQETGKIVPVIADDAGRRSVRQGEKMIRWESQHLDVRVTEGHRMLVSFGRKSGGAPLHIEKARDVAVRAGAYTLPLAARAWDQFVGLPITDDEIKFCAWTFTDSYIDKRNVCHFYQSKEPTKQRIGGLLRALKVEYVERSRLHSKGAYGEGGECTTFTVSIPRGLLEYCRNRGRHEVKKTCRLPSAWADASREQFLTLWREMLIGDGSVQGKKSGWLWLPSKGLADDLMAAALVRGLSASMKTEKTPAGVEFYRVSVRERNSITSDPRDPRATRMTVESPASGENVWCVTNGLGTLVTRRNGKAVIMGNCQIASCILLLRPSSYKSTMIQMIGRGLRRQDPERFPGWPPKNDCVVIDFGTSVLMHGSLEQAVDLAPKKGEAPTKQCPECSAWIPAPAPECPICGAEQVREETAARDVEDVEKVAMDSFVLTEIDLFNQSPFRWEELWEGLVMVATAFDAWAMAVAYGGQWHALGGADGQVMRHLQVGEKLMCLAAADDFLREHGDASAAAKSQLWLTMPATEKQMNFLPGCGPLTRYQAACHLTWKFNQKGVQTRLVEVSGRAAA